MLGNRFRMVAAGLVAAAVLPLAAAAWACTSASGPFMNDLFNQRSPVGATIDVKGGGWVPSSPVTIDWRPVEVGVAAPGPLILGSAVTDGSGGFAASVKVPATADAGRDYYVGVVQGDVTRAMPFRVAGDPVAPAVAAPAAAAWAAGSDAVALPGAVTAGGDVGGGFPAVPLVAVAVVGFGAVGVATTQVRRRRIRA